MRLVAYLALTLLALSDTSAVEAKDTKAALDLNEMGRVKCRSVWQVSEYTTWQGYGTLGDAIKVWGEPGEWEDERGNQCFWYPTPKPAKEYPQPTKPIPQYSREWCKATGKSLQAIKMCAARWGWNHR